MLELYAVKVARTVLRRGFHREMGLLSDNVLLTTVTAYQDAKGTTDKNLVALDVNPDNRADIVGTLGHEESHVRGGTSETLADMSGYSAQLLSEAAIGGYDQQYLNGIKFELGTGKDSATQSANQTLLINDNLKLIQALDNHQGEFDYSKTENLPTKFVTVTPTNSSKDAIVANIAINLTPLGVIKDFAEAKSAGDYFFAALGIVPGEKVLSGAFKAYQEAKALGDIEGMVKAVNDAKYEVGEYNTLVKTSIKNDGLDNHHVPQKNLAQQNSTPDYPQDTNAKTAPAIRLDEATHQLITNAQNANKVARSQMTPRELLADDVRMLRKYGVPNEQIQQIIQMNKDKYGLIK